MDKFTLGQCSQCGEHKALNNGICAECNNKDDMPDFFKDLFRKKE